MSLVCCRRLAVGGWRLASFSSAFAVDTQRYDKRNPNLISQNLPGKSFCFFQASSEKSSLATEVRQPTSLPRAISTQYASFDDKIDVTKRLLPNFVLQTLLCKIT